VSAIQLIHGDCIEVMRQLPADHADLVFCDPPFNLDKQYGADVDDKRPPQDYLAWCERWLAECTRILAPGGALFVYNLPRWNIRLGDFLMDSGLEFRHWIAVEFKASLPIRNKLYPAHYSLLYFTKGKPKFFERPRYPIPACRHCGGDIKDYGGHRNKLNAKGLNVSDIWSDISPVRHSKHKTRQANQLPEKLLERIVLMTTQSGDLIVDPFCGSGTTPVVAKRLGRRAIGIEMNGESYAGAVARVEGLKETA
jgi:site-specific DNA-methyltransferase (adenine-specific)